MKQFVLPIAAMVLMASGAQAQLNCGAPLAVTAGLTSVPALTGTAPATICIAGVAAAYGMWYTYTATEDTTMMVTSNVAGYPMVDTRLHVYSGACGSLVCVAGDDDSGPGGTSAAFFDVTEGSTYYIVWDSYWNPSGFTFRVEAYDAPEPPAGIVTFAATAIAGAGYAMGAVDMNNDGLDDVVTPGYTGAVISHQQAGGGFVPLMVPHSAATNSASWSFAVGDWDGNGQNDLLYGGGSGASFFKASNDGLTFEQVYFPQYIFCQRTNFVDINNDGHLDAFSCHDVAPNVAFMNDGAGNLQFNQGMLGNTCGNYGSLWTDYDNNGEMDLFVAKCGCDPVDLLIRNDGNMNFVSMAATLGLADYHQSWSSAWGDFDNDGDMDVLIGASSSGYHKLMSNNGDGTFTNVTPGSGMDTYSGQSIEWTTHDFNNDGLLDILGGGALHYNAGNMTFTHDATAPYNGPVGDLNNDGFLDVIGGSMYMRNNGNDNNWLRVRTVGVASNRNGIGARITVTSALGSQIREIRSGDGFEYMSSMIASFGLGSDEAIEQVTIAWPSGVVDVIENPDINTTLTVVEGIPTGLAQNTATTFTIAPNPVQDELTITGIATTGVLNVIDATGKLVITERSMDGRVNVASLAPGVYEVIMPTTDGIARARFTKL